MSTRPNPHPSLTRDRDEGVETPEGMYAAYRYLDRMFAEPRPHRAEEIASLDVAALSPRVQYLAWHLLVLQRRARPMLERYPNLRPLAKQRHVTLDRDILLDRAPRDAWQYFKKNGIRL